MHHPVLAPGIEISLNRALIREKCEKFIDFQLWPTGTVIDPDTWLGNFTDDELDHAYHLLNAFMYYSEPLVDQLFKAGFQNLSVIERQDGWSFRKSKIYWEQFCERLIVTYVTGENPNPSDSGYGYARKARQVLGFDEKRIVAPETALRLLASNPDLSVLFVDDFVGSGIQFIKTWDRLYDDPSHGQLSFSLLDNSARKRRHYYCPAICTSYGAREIAKHSHNSVVLSPGNLIPQQNSALDPQSVVWPDHLRISGHEFIRNASHRAGIPDDYNNVSDWRGFRQLGLTLAFWNSTPDATLPLLYWEEHGWQPLVRRS